MDCCELALYIAIGAFTLILALFAMFFGYNLKLDARTVKLERKNGKELEEINKLEQKIKKLEKTFREN
jgi:cell division protein FtsL